MIIGRTIQSPTGSRGRLVITPGQPPSRPAQARTSRTTGRWATRWMRAKSPGYTMGVWVGNNDHTPMRQIDGVTGAAPIWHNAMVYAMQGHPKTAFQVPTGVYQAKYTSNGVTSTDWFISGLQVPNNVGSGGPKALPCIKFNNDPNNPWDYSKREVRGNTDPRRSEVTLTMVDLTPLPPSHRWEGGDVQADCGPDGPQYRWIEGGSGNFRSRPRRSSQEIAFNSMPEDASP